jgi:hypothetical protein
MSMHKTCQQICFAIRTKLIKIAAKIVKGARYLTFKLCSSFPYKQVFSTILDNIKSLPLLE